MQYNYYHMVITCPKWNEFFWRDEGVTYEIMHQLERRHLVRIKKAVGCIILDCDCYSFPFYDIVSIVSRYTDTYINFIFYSISWRKGQIPDNMIPNETHNKIYAAYKYSRDKGFEEKYLSENNMISSYIYSDKLVNQRLLPFEQIEHNVSNSNMVVFRW